MLMEFGSRDRVVPVHLDARSVTEYSVPKHRPAASHAPPVALGQIFVINYVASHVTLSIVVTVPLMIGLAVGLP